MTNTRDDSAPFDADVLAETAEAHDVGESELAAAVARHQESVAALPGVENLAYEWRKQYESALLERTEDAYYLAVPEWVWSEFGDALDLGDVMLHAIIEVHRRTVLASTAVESAPPDGQTYVVLDRAAGETSADDT